MISTIVLRMRDAPVAVLILCAVILGGADVRAQESIPIRIGWQPTTTVEAQIAHVLQKTDILERNGLKGHFMMFSFGPAVNEALFRLPSMSVLSVICLQSRWLQ